jgi:hypothetical protein
MPASAAGGADAPTVQGGGDGPEAPQAGCPELLHDRQHVGSQPVGFDGQRAAAKGPCFIEIAGFPSFAPVAFLAANASRVLSPMSRRSFSASAA